MRSSQDAQIIELWLNRQASPHTRSCYRRDVDRLVHFLRKPLTGVTLGDLQGFAQSLIDSGLAPVSRLRTIAAIKSLFGFCVRMYRFCTNPAAELPLPRYATHLAERILPEEDVRRVLAAETDPRDKTLLNLIYIAGVRVSEATQLRWRNLQSRGDAGQATIFGKGGVTRAVLLPAALWSELMALRGGASAEGPVFRSRTGRPLDRGRVRSIVRAAARRAGIPEVDQISPHWLRHAHASHALDHGAPIHLVQATLGHCSVATTSAYLHARPGDSSARFLCADIFLQNSGESALLSAPSRVMDVIDAADTAKGEIRHDIHKRSASHEHRRHNGGEGAEGQQAGAESRQEGRRYATEARRCAGEGQVGEEGHRCQESAQGREGRETY